MRVLKNVLGRIGYFIAGIASLLYGFVIFIGDPKFSSLFEHKWYQNPLICFLFAIGCFIITFGSKNANNAKKEEDPAKQIISESENRPG